MSVELDAMKADLASVRASRIALASGERVDEVMREGRKLVTGKVTLDGLSSLIKVLEQEISRLENVESGRPARSAIRVEF